MTILDRQSRIFIFDFGCILCYKDFKIKKKGGRIKMSLLKERQNFPIDLKIEKIAQLKIQENRENNFAKLESSPKRSFNVEGPSYPYWY